MVWWWTAQGRENAQEGYSAALTIVIDSDAQQAVTRAYTMTIIIGISIFREEPLYPSGSLIG